jgi:hypothetical protein
MLEKNLPLGTVVLDEKSGLKDQYIVLEESNPVKESARFILDVSTKDCFTCAAASFPFLQSTDIVAIDKEGVDNAADYVCS